MDTSMKNVRQEIGGLGNLLFKEAYIWGQMREGHIPDVYVQSPRYWKRYANELRGRFDLGIRKIDRVALHIRRGDYLNAARFHTNLWDTDYYHEAVKHFPGETFLVFCKDGQNEEQDAADLAWVRENFLSLNVPFEIHEHGTETEDLNYMASCKGLIGANSTFSWWAAFLGNPAKRVVMPAETKWFTDGVVRTELLPEWITI